MLRRKKTYTRRRHGYGPFRLILSLVMMSILALGVYSAYKTFSGVDPLKINPKLAAENFLVQVLAFDPKIFFKGNSTNISSVTSSGGLTLGLGTPASNQSSPAPKPRTISFKFAVVADSENDNTDLKKALDQSKQAGVQFVIGVGDYTDVGTVDELRSVKQVFDDSGLPYHLIPGEHDLWDSRNRSLPPTQNFTSVFGPSYQSFSYLRDRFILVDNSDDYDGLNVTQQNWLNQEMARMRLDKPQSTFVFVFNPLYHPSSDHVMGEIEPSLKTQANQLVSLFSQNGVTEVIAGGTHFYASYTEPKSGLHMTVVGAISSERNIQSPRFAIVDQYSDGSYNIQDTEVKQ